jgi:hypothetical protein
MSWWHPTEVVDDRELSREWTDDFERLLALLNADVAVAVSVADLRARGVSAPAQAAYELQLAGYEIDRVYCTDMDGRPALGYRLQLAPAIPRVTAPSGVGEGCRA